MLLIISHNIASFHVSHKSQKSTLDLILKYKDYMIHISNIGDSI